MENKKKILLISNLYPSKHTPYYGSFIKNFEDELKMDTRVQSVKGIFIKGFTTNFVLKIFKYFIYYIKILFFSLFGKYDLIYVHLISHSTIPLRLIDKIKSLPLVFNIHGEDLLVTTPLARRLLNLSLPLIKKAQFLVVPSNYFKKITHIQIADYPENKIIVSPSGGIKNIFKPLEIPKPISKTINIGYVSRIDRGKGWHTLIEAVKLLNKENIDINVSIVGGGPQTELLNTIIKKDSINNVVCMGPIAHDALPTFYQSLDLFIFPTQLRESLGLVGLEAMACGIPVIGSKIGGLTDYIRDEYNGFFFTPGDSRELANKIKLFSKLDIEQRKNLSENSVITSKDYSDKIISSRLFDIIL